MEFHAPGSKFSTPEAIVEANLEEYLRLIIEASEKGVDILVFPEATLNYNGKHISLVQLKVNKTEVFL